MLRLVVLILSLCAIAFTSSLASEIEDLEPVAQTKEALILKKLILKDVKFPLPLPPLLDKHDDHFGPKFLHSLEKHPLPLRPLGVLNKKTIIQEDPALLGSKHHQHTPFPDPHILIGSKSFDDVHSFNPKLKSHLDSFLPEPKHIGSAIHEHLSSLEPKLHKEHFLHLSTEKPLLFSERHLGTHLVNENEDHINVLEYAAKTFSHPLKSKPHFPEHLVPGLVKPKPFVPLLPPPFLPPLDSKHHHGHPEHLFPEKPFLLHEPLEPKVHHHPEHVLPKKPLPFPDLLKPKIHDDSLHILPKKPLPLPDLLKPKIHGQPPHLLPKKPLPLPELLEPKIHDHPPHLLPKKPLPLPDLLKPKIHGQPPHLSPKKPLPLPELLEPKILDHPPHLLPKKPLSLPELFEPKIHDHPPHLLPKKPLPLPEILEPEFHHHPLHLLPKKPFPFPEPHPGKHFHKEHEKHVHPLDHHIFDESKFAPGKELPHLLHLEPHFPKHLVPEAVEPKPIGPIFPPPPPPPLEPKLHHHHSLDFLPKKPLPLPEPHFGIHLPKEHKKSFEPKLVGHIPPPPVLLPLEPKLHHDHPLHKAPKKPLLVPELELGGHSMHNHEDEEHIRPIIPNIFLGHKSINDKKFHLSPDLTSYTPEESVPEVVRPIQSKVFTTHVSRPLGAEEHYDHAEASQPKKALFVPEPHLSGSVQNEQDKSGSVNNPDLSITRSIPVYETTEEVETIK